MGAPTVEDQIALGRLADQYAHAVHERDAELWASVWADRDDCHWNLGGLTFDGKAAIVEFWKQAVAGFEWIWQVSPLKLFDVDVAADGSPGATATGFCYVREEFVRAGTRGSLTARYVDDCVRTPAGWKFLSRRLEILDRG